MKKVTIKKPDDWHVHFRQGDRMRSVVNYTARQFGRAIVMPNTAPPILTVDDALLYQGEILLAVNDPEFEPLMTLYLQTTTSLETIRDAKSSGAIAGIKMYPAGQTTNSEGGVVRLQDVEEQLREMERVDLPLLIHGETTHPDHDTFDREALFYTEAFPWLTSTFPKLRVSCEHLTTAEAVEMVESASSDLRIGATVTPQHLLVDRNYLLGSGLRPHAYCKPILKRREDKEALLRAVTSGNPRFFLGTDSAPHPKHGDAGKAKEVDCGCAGCFTAHAAMELYAEVFDSVDALHRLEGFASLFGARFHELSPNDKAITLVRRDWKPFPRLEFGENDELVPFRHDEPLKWRML